MSLDPSRINGRFIAWRHEIFRHALSGRAAAVAMLLGGLLAYRINGMVIFAGLVPGSRGALSYVGPGATPMIGLALVGGLFASFGLVEDHVYGRAPYAWARGVTATSYAVLRTLGPACGAAWAVCLGSVVALSYAHIHYPEITVHYVPVVPGTPLNPDRPDSWVVAGAPVLNDVLFIVFVMFITFMFTALAGAAAFLRRQFVTLLFPSAVTVAVVLVPGELGNVAARFPEGLGELSLSIVFWALLSIAALMVAIRSARRGAGLSHE